MKKNAFFSLPHCTLYFGIFLALILNKNYLVYGNSSSNRPSSVGFEEGGRFTVKLGNTLGEFSNTVTIDTIDKSTILFLIDTDGDGIDDATDIDDDNDGILDTVEGLGDPDGDGIPNSLDLDSDGDGIPDNVEAQQTLAYLPPQDTNSDGIPDVNAQGLPVTYNFNGENLGLLPINTDTVDQPDYLDTNSDNEDGNDTIEAGLILANADTDLDGLDDSIDTTVGYADVNGTINDPALLPDTDGDLHSGGNVDFRDRTSAADNDGDGVNNKEDRDDDNDGIVDVTEGYSFFTDGAGICTGTAFRFTGGSYINGSEGAAGQVNAEYRFTNVASGLDAIVKITQKSAGVSVVSIDQNSGDNNALQPQFGYALNVRGDLSIQLQVRFVQTGTTTPAQIDRVGGFIQDIDSGGGLNIREYYRVQNLVGYSIGNPSKVIVQELGAGVIQFLADGTGSAPIEPIDVSNLYRVFFQKKEINQFTFTIGAIKNTNAQTSRFYSIHFDECLIDQYNNPSHVFYNAPDTDADGVPDYLDLDSDNDGIYDVVEAGGTANADGTAADNDGNINNTTSNGVPTSVGNGLNPTDTGNDGTSDHLNLDSDTDGCSDANEAYVNNNADGGDGGQYGTGNPAPIGADGLVAAASYTTGVVAAVTDASDVSACGPTIDTDGDGIPDNVDLDDDNDGITDVAEGNGDTDGDGIQDSLDLDSDNDGIPDVTEAGGADANGDGIIDGFTDANNDGLDDATAASPLPNPDSDGDGLVDRLDLDSDNDGITDVVEAGGTDPDGDGIIGTGPITDADGDGLSDIVDTDDNNTPTVDDGPGTPLADTDFDGDGIKNRLDLDSDNDGIYDVLEAGGTDSDGDGRADDDNNNSNNVASNGIPTSAGGGLIPIDTGNDGSLDYLNLDSDADGCSDANEAYNNSNADGGDGGEYGLGAPPAINSNGEVIGASYATGVVPAVTDALDSTACATLIDTDGDGIPDNVDLDDDNDGIPDLVEGNGDTDADGIQDSLDLDSDNDGIPDVTEAGGADANGDGIIDGFTDANNDGLDDATAASPLPNPDSDGDGLVDRLDLDSDNDGITDVVEAGGTDPDGDGTIGTGPITDADGDGLSDIVDTDDNNTPTVDDGPGTPLADTDFDGDGIKNRLDLDSDNDGIHDVLEAGGTDSDGDGRADDDNNNSNNLASNGIPTSAGGGLIPIDTGNDGSLDYLNLDSDADGCSDANEAYNNSNADGGDGGQYGTGNPAPIGADGLVAAASYTTGVVTAVTDPSNVSACGVTDTDGDGIPDNVDLDDDNDGIPDLVEGNGDTDGDGIQDSLDLDSDNDGIPDVTEAGGVDANGDGIIDGFTDANNDGLDDATAASPLPNPDSDGDGLVDRLDVDSDNDGITDVVEAGGTDPDGDGIIGTGPITDADGDGLSDIVDPDDNNTPTVDDGPGTPLPIDDFDGDGIPNYLDIDSDDDGIVDNIEAQSTVGYVAPSGLDSDNDGLDDTYDTDSGGLEIVPVNTDNTDNPDFLDMDSDNDGRADIVEGWDTNGDGNPEVSPAGTDSDVDGLDDNFDNDDANPNPTNGQVPTDFPDVQSPGGDRDWREPPTTDPNDPCNTFGGTQPPGPNCDIVIENELVDPSVNDGYFEIINIGLFPNNTVEIFNRWGISVFKTNGYNNGLNAFRGFSNGRATVRQSEGLPAGVYFYIINYIKNAESKTKSGYLYVNR